MFSVLSRLGLTQEVLEVMKAFFQYLALFLAVSCGMVLVAAIASIGNNRIEQAILFVLITAIITGEIRFQLGYDIWPSEKDKGAE
jgi:uncharacterized membrane protein